MARLARYSQLARLTVESTLEKFQTTERGLVDQEIERRLRQHGFNELVNHRLPWLDIGLRQFRSAFVYLLVLASLINFLLGQLVDAALILLFVSLNALLGFYQEFRSEQTLALLKNLIHRRARVMRDGREMIVESRLIVPGDLVVIEPGDVIPADLRLIETHDLTIDESTLTGESVPVKKNPAALTNNVSAVYQLANIGFSGTTVLTGKGLGVVLATGSQTTVGQITKLVTETRHTSTFEKGIAAFSRFVLRLVLITLIGVFVANVVIEGRQANIFELFVFAIALTVSVVPEALPVVMTFSLSRGALRLAKHHVVIKRLSAIEDLGSIDVLCADKTGTLTENELTVANTTGVDRLKLIWYGALGGPAAVRHRGRPPNPFDAALVKALPDTQQRELNHYQTVAELPFDPIRRRDSAIVAHRSQRELIVRGAPERIFALCRVGQDQKNDLDRWVAQEGQKGRRVIAIASRGLTKKSAQTIEQLEYNLELLGLISFTDPIKPTVRQALQKAKALGVSVKILTGDRPEVAGQVAYEIGLVSSPTQVLTGDQFDQLPPTRRSQAVKQSAVFARVSPDQKYQIIQLIQADAEVGFLGEGINDAPALKIANVGLVVHGAADIAREAADIVLTKRSLNVIIDGIEEGRSVFANTIKYIKATLSSNYGNFYAIAIASLLIPFLPMLPLQILLVNLLSDLPMIAIATDQVDSEELRRPKIYNIRDIALLSTTLGLVSTLFDFLIFGLFYHIGPAVLQTNWFMSSILTELVFLFSIRSRVAFFRARAPSSALIGLSALAALATVGLPYTAFAQTTFHFVPPSTRQLAIILAIVGLYFVASESVKLLYYRYSDHKTE